MFSSDFPVEGEICGKFMSCVFQLHSNSKLLYSLLGNPNTNFYYKENTTTKSFVLWWLTGEKEKSKKEKEQENFRFSRRWSDYDVINFYDEFFS